MYQSYLTATQAYIDHCNTNGYPTKVFFTTGPVDSYMASGESGYEQYLKWEHIRDAVDAHDTWAFFDYADILSYNDSGELETASWDGHTFPVIHPDNLVGSYTGHIGEVGALRIAKAMWWMLARMTGWQENGETGLHPENGKADKSEIVVNISFDQIRISSDDDYFNGQINLYDIRGCLIETKLVESGVTYLDSSLLSKGFYFIELIKDNNREIRKIVLFI
ncbi:MAG: T9SS type A sorting domain-containing protein [Actinomycetia bacterium]|nr:T9SS type A sorting domain-containing protein [Actinomycetes bacterium]